MNEVVRNETVERITNPIVKEIFEESERRGIISAYNDLVSILPQEMQQPINLAFVTHVHHEKGLFIDLIGESVGIPEKTRLQLSVSADLLWLLSLLIDDIEDGDKVRNGLPTSWVKYGKEETIESSVKLLGTLLNKISSEISPQAAKRCLEYINMGMVSLHEHKTLCLGSSIGEVVKNYERRCDFHGTYQIMEMYELTNDAKKCEIAAVGLRKLNKAGQLINDLKDLINNDVYNRGHSDVRRGVVTVPIIILYNSLQVSDQKIFRKIFGNGEIKNDQEIALNQLIDKTQIEDKIIKIIYDEYDTGLLYLEKIMTKSSYKYFCDWVDYKQGRLNGYKEK